MAPTARHITAGATLACLLSGLAAAGDTRSLRRRSRHKGSPAPPKEGACNVTVTLKVAPAELQPNMSVLVDGYFRFAPLFRPEDTIWNEGQRFYSATRTWVPGLTYSEDAAIWNCTDGNIKSLGAMYMGGDGFLGYLPYQIALTYIEITKVAPTVEKTLHVDPVRYINLNNTIVIGALGCGIECNLPLVE